MKKNWHEDPNARKRVGDALEKLFPKEVKCYCGKGDFQFIGDSYPGREDYTCDYCGQLVDVKGSPQAERTGNLSVSAVPYSKYAPETLLVTKVKGQWIGEYKRLIFVKDATPRESTHHSNNGKFKNTKYILIPWKQFRNIRELGYRCK